MPPSPTAPSALVTGPARRAPALFAAALFAVLVAAPAAWTEPSPEAVEAHETSLTPAEHYAAELADRPEGAAVVVDDALAGEYDVEELEAELHEAFAVLDVPYHVVASPFPDGTEEWGSGSFLVPLADRHGDDGLYAHLSPAVQHQEVEARGLDLPVSESTRWLLDDPRLDFESTIDETATVIVERLQGTAPLPDRTEPEDHTEPGWAAAAWESFRHQTDPNTAMGPENLGTVSGLLAGLVLGCGGMWIWWRRAGKRAGFAETGGVAVGALALAALSVAGPYTYMMGVPEDGSETADDAEEARFEAPYVAATPRVERLLSELESSPLYAAPLVPMSKEGLAATTAQVEGAELPVRALVVPMHGADESQGDPEVLAYALSALTEGEAVYLVATLRASGEVGIAAGSTGLGIDPHALANATERVRGETPAQALEAALPAVEDLSTEPGRADTAPPFAESGHDVYETGPREERFFDDGFVHSLMVVGPVLASLLFGGVCGAVAVARRVRARTGGDRERMREPVLRRLALREVGAMTRELEAAGNSAVPIEAVRDADRALVVLGRTTDSLDLLGAAVLARRSRAALAGDMKSSRRAVCAVNPLHGLAPRRGRVLVVEGRRRLCEPCAALPERERSRRVVELRIDGTWVPHLKLAERAWVRTNYGSASPELIDAILETSDA